MPTDIPSVDLPPGYTPPTPSAAPSGSSIPPLPSLPSIDSMLNVDTSQGVLNGLAAAANGKTADQQASDYNNSTVGKTGNAIFSQLGEWLKSIALPGTFSLVALLLIVLSVYIAVTRHGGVVLPK